MHIMLMLLSPHVVIGLSLFLKKSEIFCLIIKLCGDHYPLLNLWSSIFTKYLVQSLCSDTIGSSPTGLLSKLSPFTALQVGKNSGK